MKGDVLIINDNHRKAARQCLPLILEEIKKSDNKYMLSVAGESGAGKSEIAASLAEELEKEGLKTYIFQQDDYFVFPPKTNAEKRKEDIKWVGTQEVKIDLLDSALDEIQQGKYEIEKPLVNFQEDKIGTETVSLGEYSVFIAEGTYTTLLNHLDCRIFIDRNYHDTKASRLERNREEQDDFLEKILMIEHEIISKHKAFADIIIGKDYQVKKVK
ncbi:MAG: hypothetical protein K9G58_01985 [Bacteroidales bacterium]|nr:hypothetical protein [Bacteroidales bacterium]MCF8388744.1 hypothetical protein [Bacteroidales bacterium]MCF8396905.1 hypothetical protein [Bacteroidales bacterium]